MNSTGDHSVLLKRVRQRMERHQKNQASSSPEFHEADSCCDTCHDVGKYLVESYFRGRKLANRAENPLWVAFLSREATCGFLGDILGRVLLEQFSNSSGNLYIARRNVDICPSDENTSDTVWLHKADYKSDVLIVVDADFDKAAGNLITRQGVGSSSSPLIILNNFGDDFVTSLDKMNNLIQQGYNLTRGVIIPRGGPCMNNRASLTRLLQLVELSVFDFVLTFTNSDTNCEVLAQAVAHFMEGVHIYRMDPWMSLLLSFGNCSVLDDTSAILVWTKYERSEGILERNGKNRSIDTWTKAKMTYRCQACGYRRTSIRCPQWIYGVEDHMNLVRFRWPLTREQLDEVGADFHESVVVDP
ncbi:hypothetical protein CONPUDRAFT_78294 [Coniophora puteana RWD-64-598 SS2]|uniref:Uncharacterized protein n=1 Tax=Coniophora puteana (strain RWD-64-598) TaxID=741705 RepID=R7SE67_CONPW|nr:uncharacterized protein CONPUDRAFT_78294 [Coniophora puteana RWD-64-598 SS2]EIW74150.1 hypothetical protein CONPUDRAFT_78294 [Coniophora puteana RWD-64-598 SS2]